eukprot:CAMPEP_0178440988 /NCGR_PEP_ID=MMETSP0689_2-20121128/37191_1 /TAXON_ID=160604 /ORGANISM="Amphidinium massartii, Strain CS-259" /LENGTH=108 /DNA_ID=CAMNT_0020064037 /DNA_START=578 /DNA_END=902 /DNA_ORIENTATION=-
MSSFASPLASIPATTLDHNLRLLDKSLSQLLLGLESLVLNYNGWFASAGDVLNSLLRQQNLRSGEQTKKLNITAIRNVYQCAWTMKPAPLLRQLLVRQGLSSGRMTSR